MYWPGRGLIAGILVFTHSVHAHLCPHVFELPWAMWHCGHTRSCGSGYVQAWAAAWPTTWVLLSGTLHLGVLGAPLPWPKGKRWSWPLKPAPDQHWSLTHHLESEDLNWSPISARHPPNDLALPEWVSAKVKMGLIIIPLRRCCRDELRWTWMRLVTVRHMWGRGVLKSTLAHVVRGSPGHLWEIQLIYGDWTLGIRGTTF